MFDNNTLKPNQSDNSSDLNNNKDFPFKKINQDDKKLSMSKGPVEDILAETDKQASHNILSEKKEISSDDEKIELANSPQVPSMDQKPVVVLEKDKKNETVEVITPPQQQNVVKQPKNKIFKILIIFFGIIVVILIGIFAYQYFSSDIQKESETNNSSEASDGFNELLDMVIDNKDQEQNQEQQEEENPENIDIDTDNDGLSDNREYDLGTNPNQFDTDADGLNDFEEVEIYGSDPIQVDTDGDGYFDGNEVENGYDPLKPGNARL
ncbi:hypothetical protein ACFL1Y_00565 [Patescibacteria group bacterium]